MGSKGAVKTQDGWQSLSDAAKDDGSGGFNPTRFLAFRLQNYKAPAAEAADLADKAKELKKEPIEIKKLIGLNLVADGADDVVVGFLGGCPGTNYGENNSLMAITRNYSVPVLMTAGAMAILLGFVGKLAAVVNTIPVAVIGGLSIYLFGVIGMQGVALIQSEKVNLFEPRQLAVGATILVAGIGGALGLPNGIFPFVIPVLFPNGIPAIVFAAIVGILLNLLFLVLPPSLFGVKERENINE
jgi:uracil permease